jgi:phosphoenolpyruvate phosphomutase
MSTAAQKLRQRLKQPGPVIAIGGHSPLSAVLVEESGADVVWASGFEISAAHAMPDANILTMAEQLDVAKRMARRINIPVIADCDNGFGNAINVIRTVQDYEADGIAGICFEDNIFPKRCSFYAGVKRELVSAEEHAGKIRAALDSRRTKDFVIIARTEAYIAGWGLEEATRRAHIYADAGADMILVHSKQKDFAELKSFAEGWDRPTPLVTVPTIYSHVSADELHEAGFKLVIFANHGLRTSLRAMRETFQIMMKARRCDSVEDRICKLTEVYDVIGVPKMRSDEKIYMPAGGDPVQCVILAAGDSAHLGELTADKPKAMLEVRGKTILQHQVAALNTCGIKDIAVVRGYQKDALTCHGVTFYDNDEWASEGELLSLLKAKAQLKGRTVILYGDIIFDAGILQKLLKSEGDVAIAVDRAINDTAHDGPGKPDLVHTQSSQAESHRFVPGAEDAVLGIGQQLDQSNGEFAGLLSLSPAGLEQFLAAYQAAAEADSGGTFHEAESLKGAALTDMLQDLIQRGTAVHAVSIYKGWSEVDTFEDYRRAWKT